MRSIVVVGLGGLAWALAAAHGGQVQARVLEQPAPTVVLREATAPSRIQPAQPPDQASETPAVASPSPTVFVTATPEPSATGAATSTAQSGATSTVQLPSARPILVVDDTYVEPSRPSPGSDIKVRIEVENVGAVDAEHVQLALSSAVFQALDSGAVLYKEEIDAGETRPFDVRLRVDSAATAGVYPLGIELRWEDASGVVYGDATTIGIQVETSTAVRPQLVVTSSSVPGKVMPGVPFQVGLTVRNGGGSDARNITATSSGETLAQRSAGGPIDLAPGASGSLSLDLVAADAPEAGAVSQALEIRYFDPDGQEYLLVHPVGTVVGGDRGLRPELIVLRYEAGDEVHPGERFDLVLYVGNVGSRGAVRARLVLGGEGSASLPDVTGGGGSAAALGVFAPLETSNVRFLGDVAAGSTQTVVQPMIVDGAAKPGVYNLDVGFEYTDAEGNPLASNASVGLLVSREYRLQVNPVDVVTSTIVGATEPLALELVNAGDAEVSVGNVIVDGGRAFEVEDGTVFVGPLEAGGYFPIDATLTAREAGTYAVTVTAEYFDDFRRAQTLVETFEIEVAAVEEHDLAEPFEVEGEAEELLWLRVLKGFLGLGASPPPPAAAPAPSDIGGQGDPGSAGTGSDASIEITVP